MTPIDFALTVLLAISFGLSLVVLAIVALLLEALMFALGLMLTGGRSGIDR
jgi:hypothetical protein